MYALALRPLAKENSPSQVLGGDINSKLMSNRKDNSNIVGNATTQESDIDSLVGGADLNNVTNQIIKFIEGIRMQSLRGSSHREDYPEPGPSGRDLEGNVEELAMDHSKKKADQYIIDAEKYKATVNAQTGRTAEANQHLDIDDQFFHVTCHIDDALKAKIEKGDMWIWKNCFQSRKYTVVKTNWT